MNTSKAAAQGHALDMICGLHLCSVSRNAGATMQLSVWAAQLIRHLRASPGKERIAAGERIKLMAQSDAVPSDEDQMKAADLTRRRRSRRKSFRAPLTR